MPPKRPTTRSAAEKKRAYDREYAAKRYAQLSEKERSARSKESGEIRKKAKKIDRDRALTQQERMTALKAEVGAARKEITALKDAYHELQETYVLTEDEPEVDDAKAKAAEEAFKRAYETPGALQKLTHETPAEFDELWQLLSAPLAKINYRGEKRVRSAGQRQLLPDRVQLFIALLFLRQYPTYALLSFAVGGLSPLSIHHYIFRVLVALSELDALAITWPSDVEMAEHVKKPANWPYPDKKDLVAATDGTEIRVARPTKYAIGNKHYSAKKKQYALNVLLVVLLSGVIIYCSLPTAKMNDQGLFNDCNVRARFIGKPWGLIADSGFTLNSKEAVKDSGEIICASPHKQPKGRKKAKANAAKQGKAMEKAMNDLGRPKRKKIKSQPLLYEEELVDVGAMPIDIPSLSNSQRTHNVELSRMRVVVENTNARLKIYKVLGSKLRHYRPGDEQKDKRKISPALIVKVVVGLTNRHIKMSPCRSADWVPEKVVPEDLLSAEGSECDECLSAEETDE